MPTVEELFEKTLTSRNIPHKKIDTNRYEVETEHGTRQISLQNVEKDYLRGGDAQEIEIFLERVLQPVIELPGGDAISSGLFVAMEPSDYDGIEQTIHRPLTEKTFLVLAHYDETSAHIQWLQDDHLIERGIAKDDAWNNAYKNLEKIMAEAAIDFTDIDGEKLVMLKVEDPYKASMLLTRTIKQKVSDLISWPVYAVAPTRDFVYLFAKEGNLIERVGSVVVREYEQSGYPISTEVWELSDEGQNAIGAYSAQ